MFPRHALLAACLLSSPLALPALTFDDWRAAQFPEEQVYVDAIAGPIADPDVDYLTNLQEYVHFGQPLAVDTNLAPVLESIGGFLALTYRERHGLDDVSIRLLGSDILQNWITYNSVTEVRRQVFADFDLVTVRAPQVFTGASSFLRLRLELSPLPGLRVPTQLGLAVLTPTVWAISWTDPNTSETGYAVERKSTVTQGWVRLVTLGPDTGTWQHPAADFQAGLLYRVIALAGGLETISATVTPTDLDIDGIPDALELGAAYTGTLGTFATYPDKGDSDGDGMPDGWEILNGFDALNPMDAELDTDGDSFNNRDECTEGSDPRDPLSLPPDTDGDGMQDILERRTPGLDQLDYYDNFIPIVTVEKGAGQSGIEGMAPAAPLVISVKYPDGRPLANAPVTVYLLNGQIMVEPTHVVTHLSDDSQPRTNLFGFLFFSGVLHSRSQP